MVNVGGEVFDVGVGRSCWLKRRGTTNLEGMEAVTFQGDDGDGDLPADGDGPVASGDWNPIALGGTPATPPPLDGGGADEDGDLPTLLSSDSDGEGSPPPPRVSARGNRRVPATRYDEIFEQRGSKKTIQTVTFVQRSHSIFANLGNP